MDPDTDMVKNCTDLDDKTTDFVKLIVSLLGDLRCYLPTVVKHRVSKFKETKV